MELENSSSRGAADLAAIKTRSRIRGLWVGLAIWVFILINALRVAPALTANWVPMPIYALGLLVNLGLIAYTAYMLRKSYRDLRSNSGPGESA
jgi:hypothetical protein